MKKGTNMHRDEFSAITCNFIQAREITRVQGTIGFGFTSHSPLSQGGHIAPGDQKSFVLPR